MENQKNEAVCVTTCPGGCNVSMMSYKAATMLAKEGVCRFVRIAGEKAREKDTLRLQEADKMAEKWILVEGCEKRCGQEAFSIAGIQPDHCLCVTDLGIKRENKIDFTPDELDRVVQAVATMITGESDNL